MQGFPSSLKNDGRAAFIRSNNISKNNKVARHTYAPKYAQTSLIQHQNEQSLPNGFTGISKNASSLKRNFNNKQNHQTLVYKQRENQDSNEMNQQLSANNLNKTNKRRANSAMPHTNRLNQHDINNTSPPIPTDFNVEGFLNSIQIESELNENFSTNTKSIKKKSRTGPNSPSDSDNIYTSPQQTAKSQEKRKEENKHNSPPKQLDYDHLNNKELYPSGPNMEKFVTRLNKESRKDAVLQRSILANYTQNQIEYVGINKEKKKSVSTEKMSKSLSYNSTPPLSNENESEDIPNAKMLNDDTYEFAFDSAISTSSNSSRNAEQSQESNTKSKPMLSKNEDKFSHLNCRMTSLINYNDLAKIQSKYTKKIKDVNKPNKAIKKDDDEQSESETNSIPPRLFFSRTPLFDDPENPKQRETQRILINSTLPRSASTSRSYQLESSIKLDHRKKNKTMNDFTPHNIINKQNLGPTPQSRSANSGIYSIPNSPHQRTAISNLSIVSPHVMTSAPHSQSGQNSGRKNNFSSLIFSKNKNRNKPPIIPNSKSNSTSNTIYNNSEERNNSPNNNNNFNKTAPISRARAEKTIINSKYSRNSLKQTEISDDNDDSLFDNDDSLVAKPRIGVKRRPSSLHRSWMVGSEKESLVPGLLKLQNLSDTNSPPTSNSSANSTYRSQNTSGTGVFKLNPILPKKKQPKEEKPEDAEDTEKSDKMKPVDSITFQMTALEKFKREKKKKKLEENGFYYYRREKKQRTNDQQKGENGQSNGENTQNKQQNEGNQNQSNNNNNEKQNNDNDDINSSFPIDANNLIENDYSMDEDEENTEKKLSEGSDDIKELGESSET